MHIPCSDWQQTELSIWTKHSTGLVETQLRVLTSAMVLCMCLLVHFIPHTRREVEMVITTIIFAHTNLCTRLTVFVKVIC